jgi:hypothetical protein
VKVDFLIDVAQCYVWCVVCYVWCVVCYVWCVVCYVLCVVCCMLCVVCYVWCSSTMLCVRRSERLWPKLFTNTHTPPHDIIAVTQGWMSAQGNTDRWTIVSVATKFSHGCYVYMHYLCWDSDRLEALFDCFLVRLVYNPPLW